MSTASIRGAQRAEQWRERIMRQADSGKSVAAFCREQGIAPPTFYWRRNRLARQGFGATSCPDAAFPFLDLGTMPAETQGDGSLSIRLDLPGGITLTIARS